MTDGENLYAFRYAVNDKANTLYYRATGDNVVVVSEPLDKDRAIWMPVPDNHVLVARAGRRASSSPRSCSRARRRSRPASSPVMPAKARAARQNPLVHRKVAGSPAFAGDDSRD